MSQPPNQPSPASLALPLSASMLALMLAALAMLGPFSVDTYLPAFPAIEQALAATPIEVQQTLTSYMLAFSLMTLWHGALSDTFGRRNTILVALAVYALASLGCLLAPSIESLWSFRVLQGLSAGAGTVIGRAIIRDLYMGAPAEKLLALVMMIFSIAPAIAPIFGGWIVKLLDWRYISFSLFAYGVLLFWWCWRRLPETLPASRRQSLDLNSLFRRYTRIFGTPLFHLRAGTVAFNFGGLFLYVAAAPAFILQHLGLGPHQFGWQFIPAVLGIFLGSLSANRLAGRLPITRQVAIGFIVLVTAALGNVLYHIWLAPSLPWTVIPLFFYTWGMGVITPGATMLVLDLFPEIRGTVASCQSFTQTMLGAIVAGLIAPLLDGSVLRLAAGQFVFGVLAWACWHFGVRLHARSTTESSV
jgi:DHA1 family bicyclomycin/chloramphenicol resistance-like MFS transporter